MTVKGGSEARFLRRAGETETSLMKDSMVEENFEAWTAILG